MAASEKDSDLLLVVSEQVKEIVKKLSECDNEKGESKRKEKSKLYELFYGSDAEDTDEEDWPQIDDEERERMLLERGPPSYNRKAFEEARKISAFKCSHEYLVRLECRNMPRPPPPQPPPPSPPPSSDFHEHLRLLDQLVKQIQSLPRHQGLESPC